MTLFFRKRKAGRQSEASQKVIEWLDNRLRSFAAYLSRRTEGVPPRTIAAIIIAACFFLSVCLTIAVFNSTKISRNIQVPPVRAPLINTYRQRPAGDAVLQRIRHFRLQLDSLRRNDFVRYDSLMKNRPHLLDSILGAEQLWNE